MLPSSSTDLRALQPPPSVAVLNLATGRPLTGPDAAGVLCTMSLSTAAAGVQIGILGQIVVPLNTSDGVAVFSSVGVDAPFATQLNASVACARDAGGVITPARAPISVSTFSVDWAAPPPATILFNTPFQVALSVFNYSIDERTLLPIAGSETPIAGVQCALGLGTASSAAPIPVLFGSATTALAISDATGRATFVIYLQCDVTKLNCTTIASTCPLCSSFSNACPRPASCAGLAAGTLTATCSVAGRAFSTPGERVRIALVEPYFIVPPPRVWVPSTSRVFAPLTPAPVIGLRLAGGGATVSTLGATCSVGPPNPPVFVNQRATSYAFVGAEPTIELADVQVNAAFGAQVDLTVVCGRAQGDASAVLVSPLRVVDSRPVWATPFPDSVGNTIDKFSVIAYVVDAGVPAANDTHALAVAQGALAPYALRGAASVPLLPAPANAVWLDNKTQCTLVPDVATNQINPQVARAVKGGVVVFPNMTVVAPVGAVFTGTVRCALDGDVFVMPPLAWSLRIDACGAGTEPKAQSAASTECTQCAAGFYSDGGGATCVPCPLKSSLNCFTCTSGIVSSFRACPPRSQLQP